MVVELDPVPDHPAGVLLIKSSAVTLSTTWISLLYSVAALVFDATALNSNNYPL